MKLHKVEKRFTIGKFIQQAVITAFALGTAFICFSLWSAYDINGPAFLFDSRLTKESKNYKMLPGTEFDVEFPEMPPSAANLITEFRIGWLFYDNAVTFATHQALVTNAVGKVSEVRPARGENATFRPFTDGNGGGVVTLRITGDRGVIVVCVHGSGLACQSAYLETIAIKSLNAETESQAQTTLSPPIRLLTKEEEAEYDKIAAKQGGSAWTQAEQLEKDGKVKEAEIAWKNLVAESERRLDNKHFPSIRYQMLLESKTSKSWSAPFLISALNFLAEFYRRQKRPDKEREILRAQMAVEDSVCPEELSGSPECLRQIANSYEKSGQIKEAAECMAEELALHEKRKNPFRRYVECRRQKYQQLMKQLDQEHQQTTPAQ